MEIYDISRTIRKGMPVWPGDQKFRCHWTMQRSDGDPCNVAAVTMSAHAGTHIDAPFHCDDSGASIVDVPLRCCLGVARVVEISAERCISARDLRPLNWEGVERILVKTRASKLADDRFERDYVYFSEEAAEFLSTLGIVLLGTDSPSVDAYSSTEMPVHRILLRKGITILESARMVDVTPGDYELICLPLKFAGLDGSPVRAILRKSR